MTILFSVIITVIVLYSAYRLVRRAVGFVKDIFKSDGRKDKKEVKDEAEEPKEKQPLTQEEIEEEIKNQLDEQIRGEFEGVTRHGITESFWNKDSAVTLDSKELADQVVRNSQMTYLEFNNRHMADSLFSGFNLNLEEGNKLTMTYQGHAIAILSRIETKDKDTDKSRTLYRVNTFPPRLGSKTCTEDVTNMLDARGRIKSCEGNPDQVLAEMLNLFCKPENIRDLKMNIVPKIQAKESKHKERSKENRPSIKTR